MASRLANGQFGFDMREQFEKLAEEGKISRQHIDNLVALATSGYCYHRSWGCGKIRTLDPVFARFTIDFPDRPGHTMALTFAAETLRPIPKDHILVKKTTELAALQKLVQDDPVELVVMALKSCDGRATLDQLQRLLTPDIVQGDWRKWWESTKGLLKKSGRVHIPSKKTDPLILLEKPVPLSERLAAEFANAKGLKERIAVAAAILKSANEMPEFQLLAQDVINALNAEINAYYKTQPATVLEAISVRDELRKAAGIDPAPDELQATDLWNQNIDPAQTLEKIPLACRRFALESLKLAKPDSWVQTLLQIINRVSAKLCHNIAELLTHEGHLEALKQTVERLITERTASSELLLWLVRDRSDLFADVLGPNVFKAILAAIERDQYAEKRTHRLRDYLVQDQNLVHDLLQSADLDMVRDITRSIQLSPSFDDERDRRLLLGRIVKLYPMMQAVIASDHPKHEQHLIVSWESLERKRAEYDELVHKKIPANAREIAHALSYGDLRENAEYKAAKDMQRLLFERKIQLESELARAKGTDFANVDPSTVCPGTIVTLVEVDTNNTETITILGAWDNDPDKNIISYLSPLAQTLLGHKPNDVVELQLSGPTRRYRIACIEPFNKTLTDAPQPPVPPIHTEPSTATGESQSEPSPEQTT